MLEAAKALELLKKRIDSCRKREFLPAELVDLVEKIYTLQLEARDRARISIQDLSTADAMQRSQGAPLVERSNFPFDHSQAEALFHQFLDIAAGSIASLSEASKLIASSLQDGSLDLARAMQAHRDGNEAFFAQWAETTSTAPRLLPMLVQAAMTPSLEKAAEMLGTSVNLKESWAHGHCPLCGSMPIMTDLREKEGFRYNTCGFCHAEYHAPRLQCPYCLENDTAKLEYYDAAEEPGLRINACKSCKMYIKQTDFRAMDRKSLPLIDDLESLGLDIAAREKKLKRPTLSAWGF